MKSKVTPKRLLILLSVAVFIGLYLTAWIYTWWHSKQGNLWLLILEVAGVPLTYIAYIAFIRNFVGGPLFRTGPLAVLLPALVATDLVLGIFHLLGFLAEKPENQLTLAYGPLLLVITIWSVYALDRHQRTRQKV